LILFLRSTLAYDGQVRASGDDATIAYHLIAVFDDANGALVLSGPGALIAASDPPAPCTFQLVATFHDPITDPESGTVTQTICPGSESACETTWVGTWVRPSIAR
jgi:hypothetical protein